MFGLLRSKFQLDGTGRLLDLGCGTGAIALGLRNDFAEVVGMDPEPELIREAESIAAEAGAKNVRWIEAGSEDLARMRNDLGTFRLVTMANAFHWMDRDATLRILYEMIERDGGIAVLGGETLGIEPAGTQRVIQDVIRRWLGETRRAGTGTYVAPAERHEVVIARSSFRNIEHHNFVVVHRRTTDEILGGLYSTSFASPYVLGSKREAFEADLCAELQRLSPNDSFSQTEQFGAILAWKDTPAA